MKRLAIILAGALAAALSASSQTPQYLPANGCTSQAGGKLSCPSVTAAKLNGVVLTGQTLTANGDSITAGYGACGTTEPCSAAYAPTIAAAQQWNLVNEANNGDQLYDQIQKIYADPLPTASSVGLMMIGQNDQNLNVISYPQPEWIASLRAAYLWRLAPNIKTGQNSACVTSGTWATDDYWPTIGKKTSVNGSTFTCSFYGPTGYLIVGSQTSGYPAFTVTVDGVTQTQPQGQAQVYNGGACSGSQCSTFTPLLLWTTALGTGRPNSCPYSGSVAACTSPYALRFSGFSNAAYNGVHVIVVTYNSALAQVPLRILGVAGSGNQLNANTGPYYYAGLTYTGSQSDANYDGLNQNVQQVVEELASDGLGISLVDVRGACFTTSLLPNCNHYDGTHPTAPDSILIANSFLRHMNFTSDAHVRGFSAQSRPHGFAGGDLRGQYPNPYLYAVNGAVLPGLSAFLGMNAQKQLVTPSCSPNTIVAGPNSGVSPGAPTCRPLVSADVAGVLPHFSQLELGSVGSPCTTAASIGAVCTNTVTWPATFADSSVTIACSGTSVSTGAPLLQTAVETSTSAATITTVALTAVAAKFASITCVGVHL